MKHTGVKDGAVSLFMVIFAMLIITVITVGFLRLMTADQRQATENDLSQSAYDSALAGVEDAKRALLGYEQDCHDNGCKAELASTQCNAAVARFAGVNVESNGEVFIQQSSGSASDRALDQAYTCVTIEPDTREYLSSIGANESKIVPLRGVGDFRSVRVSWFSSAKDVKRSDKTVDLPGTAVSLPRQDDWPEGRPSVLRTQLMQVAQNGFRMSDFDAETGDGKSNANTLFLSPTTSTVNTANLIGADNRRTDSSEDPLPGTVGNTPYPAACQSPVPAGGYACSMTIQLPDAVGSSSEARTAYLRLTAQYVGTSFKVELLDGASNVVKFDGVQPKVDSTGRANDLFRRVEARVDLEAAQFPYPEAAVDTSGNLCKDFMVSPLSYIASASCRP